MTFTASPAGLDNYDFFVNATSVQSTASDTYTTTVLSDNDSVYVIGYYLGCPGPASNSFQFVVNPIPVVGVINDDGTICYGDDNTFHAEPSGLDQYDFFINSVLIQSGPDSVFTFAPINDDDTVTVTATNLNCPSLLSNATVAIVNPLPTATFSSDTVCQGESTQFDVVGGTGVNIATYQWIAESGGDTVFGTTPHFNIYGSAGTFSATLIIIDDKTCKNTITNPVVVDPNPIADFSMLPDSTTIMNPLINFTDASNPPSPDTLSTWTWDFGDGENSVFQNPVHIYADSGYYTVILEVMNEFGCIDEFSDIVKIEPEHIIHFPNSFTPNGDTYNDVFMPKGIGINSEFEMYIFNRWGDIIFEAFDATLSWDGFGNKGKKPVQEGVYVYVVYFRDHIGKQHEYVGHVTLIR